MSSSGHAVAREEWNHLYRADPVLWPIDPGPFLGAEVGDKQPGRALDLGAGRVGTASGSPNGGGTSPRSTSLTSRWPGGRAWAEERGSPS